MDLLQTTTKKLFRLTHRESGGEMKKTFGYGTKMEIADIKVGDFFFEHANRSDAVLQVRY